MLVPVWSNRLVVLEVVGGAGSLVFAVAPLGAVAVAPNLNPPAGSATNWELLLLPTDCAFDCSNWTPPNGVLAASSSGFVGKTFEDESLNLNPVEPDADTDDSPNFNPPEVSKFVIEAPWPNLNPPSRGLSVVSAGLLVGKDDPNENTGAPPVESLVVVVDVSTSPPVVPNLKPPGLVKSTKM